MTAFDPNRTEDLAVHEARFWEALKSTLSTVFDADPALASEYRSDLIKAPPLQRALALHDDPLDVASTLTGLSLTTERIANYEAMKYLFDDTALVNPPFHRTTPQDRALEHILSRMQRDESAPMVAVKMLNKFMGELGYHPLDVKSGVAYFLLEKKARKRRLPRIIEMETLPGLSADREEVYRLDRVINVLNGLQEFARQRNSTSSIIRIQKIKARMLRRSGIDGGTS